MSGETPIARLKRVAGDLPGVVEGTSYGTPALKVGKHLLVRIKDDETFVLFCQLDEKELLIGAAPAIYFETDHYKGWPAILARGAAIGDDELRHRIEATWHERASKKLLALIKP